VEERSGRDRRRREEAYASLRKKLGTGRVLDKTRRSTGIVLTAERLYMQMVLP
jgi:hypothetical protein